MMSTGALAEAPIPHLLNPIPHGVGGRASKIRSIVGPPAVRALTQRAARTILLTCISLRPEGKGRPSSVASCFVRTAQNEARKG